MALADALESMGTKFDALWKEDNFSGVIAMLDDVRPAVDAFFDGVMVMDSDPAVRANRLGLLRTLLSRMEKIADFSALQL
jgi:glycyl-tRNA synthetase beta chain